MAGESMLVFPCVTKSDLIAFQNLKVNGEQEYQLSSLAMFGEPDDPRFAFVAHGPVEREWFIVFDIAGNAELAAQVAAARLGGFYPTLVTGTGSHDFAKPDYYLVTVVFERLPSGEALQWAVQPSVTVFEDWEGFAETLKDTSAMVVSADSFGTVTSSGKIWNVEDAPHPVKPLLNLKQLLLMGLGPENDPTLLLGIDSSTPIQLGPTSLSRPNWGQYLRLFKNGGEDGATAFAALYRKGFGGGSGPQQIVIVFAQDGARDGIFEVSADAILAPARRMVDWGYWADERNLYDQLL